MIPITTALLAIGASRAAAQTSGLDVGTVLTSGKVIWVRATTAGAVEFFMSQGYRDALARPSLLDANRLVQWTDSAKALHAPATGIADAKSPADTGLAFDRWVGSDSSGLEIKRDGSTLLRVSDTPARELVDLLARGAQLSQRLSAPPPQQVAAAPESVPASAPQSTPAPTEPAATITVQQVALQQVVVAAPSPNSIESPSWVSVPVPEAAAPPALNARHVAAAPAEAIATESVRDSVDSVPPPPVKEPTLTPSMDATLPREASPSMETRRAAVTISEVAAPALPPATVLDKHIDTPLGPFVVPAAKLTDRDTQIRYCYTELGLRYDRHLTGDVTVRVNVNDAGMADTVEVIKRTWDGVAAAEVESCMRALIEDWSFDDRQPADSKTIELRFTLSPAMRTAASDATAVQQPPR